MESNAAFPRPWPVIWFRLTVAAISLLAVLYFGGVLAWYVLTGWPDDDVQQMDIGLPLFVSLIYFVLVGAPSLIVGLGLRKRKIWPIYLAFVHDGLSLTLLVHSIIGFGTALVASAPIAMDTIEGLFILFELCFVTEGIYLLFFLRFIRLRKLV